MAVAAAAAPRGGAASPRLRDRWPSRTSTGIALKAAAPARPYPYSFEEVARVPTASLEVLAEGDWTKVSTLGEGFLGKVISAVATPQGRRKGLPEQFALKAMRWDKLEGAQGIESGLNELHAAMGLKCFKLPFVNKVLFVARDDQYLYVGTELCPEGELLAIVNKSRGLHAEEWLREMAKQLLRALAALHFLGIAHRDVSLENLLVAEDGTIRLIDFAQMLMVHAPCEVASEALVPRSPVGLPGKEFYRPPELFFSESYSAKKLDTFAAGVVLFACVARVYPFSAADLASGAAPQQELASGGCARIGKMLRQYAPDATPELEDLLALLMAPDPSKRLTAQQALQHPWIVGTPPRATRASGYPTGNDTGDASSKC